MKLWKTRTYLAEFSEKTVERSTLDQTKQVLKAMKGNEAQHIRGEVLNRHEGIR